MKASEVLQKDHEGMFSLYKSMKPEERLLAYLHHSELIYEIYQAGVNYRRGLRKQ